MMFSCSIRFAYFLAFLAVVPALALSNMSLASDVLISSDNTAVNQLSPKVAISDSGSFVIVWTENSQDNETWAIYSQVFDSSGNPISGDVTVTTGTNTRVVGPPGSGIPTSYRITPRNYSVSMDSAGNFAIVLLVGSNQTYISALRFNSIGERIGNVIPIYSGGRHLYSPQLVLSDNGQLAVVWTLSWADGEFHIYFRAFHGDGEAIGEAVNISGEHGYSSSPRIAVTPTGQYGVTWGGSLFSSIYSLNRDTIRFLLINANGESLSNLLSFEEGGNNGGFEPKISINQNGEFTIVWNSYIRTPEIEPNGIQIQKFNSVGDMVGENSQLLPTHPGNPSSVSLLMKGDGNFALISKDSTNDKDIFIQAYDREGQSVNERLVVNSDSTYSKTNISAAMNALGKYVVVWSSQRLDIDKTGIYFRLHDDLDTNPPPTADTGPDISVDENIQRSGGGGIGWFMFVLIIVAGKVSRRAA